MRVVVISSSRVKVIFTGRPVRMASSAVTPSSSQYFERAPKPPPDSMGITLTCDRGRLHTWATSLRTK